MKSNIILLILSVIFSLTITINAQTELDLPQDFDLTSQATFTTNYIYRGLSNTQNRPAIGLTLGLEHKSGLYVEFEGFNIENTEAYLESNYYFGYASQLSDIISYDLTYAYYDLIGTGTDNILFNGSSEALASISYKLESLGSVFTNLGYKLTDDNDIFLELGVETEFDTTISVASVQNVGAYVDLIYNAFVFDNYFLDVQLVALMPDDNYKTENNLEDTEVLYALKLRKDF